jgi:diaminopimelate epimerase
MACGSGAIASAIVAIQRGAVSPPVTVQVPGGELTVQCDDGNVLLIGPAERVFDTEIELGNP